MPCDPGLGVLLIVQIPCAQRLRRYIVRQPIARKPILQFDQFLKPLKGTTMIRLSIAFVTTCWASSIVLADDKSDRFLNGEPPERFEKHI